MYLGEKTKKKKKTGIKGKQKEEKENKVMFINIAKQTQIMQLVITWKQ